MAKVILCLFQLIKENITTQSETNGRRSLENEVVIEIKCDHNRCLREALGEEGFVAEREEV